MRTITCPDCGGSGYCRDYWSDDLLDCWTCDGSGRFDVPSNQEDLDDLGIPASAADLETSPSELSPE